MRELEASLQQFGKFLIKAPLDTEKAAPFCLCWVRRFLTRPASNEPLADQVQRFCEELEKQGTFADWQIHQADHALRIYFVNFLHRTDWHRRLQSAIVDERDRTRPLAALEALRCASALDTTFTILLAAMPTGSDASSPTSANGSGPRTRL